MSPNHTDESILDQLKTYAVMGYKFLEAARLTVVNMRLVPKNATSAETMAVMSKWSREMLEALGVDPAWVAEHRGSIEHFFHLAAIYDMTADDATNETMNVGGTRHALELAEALEVGCFHQVSSVAAAGEHRGRFDETMFDEGQHLPSPYHRTKFESERIVREEATVPWRVYRPAIVVGDSQSGEMDKVVIACGCFLEVNFNDIAFLIEPDSGAFVLRKAGMNFQHIVNPGRFLEVQRHCLDC